MIVKVRHKEISNNSTGVKDTPACKDQCRRDAKINLKENNIVIKFT